MAEHETKPLTNVATIFGRLMSALRAETGLNQIEFSALSGMHEAVIARLETGRNTPTIDQILLLESFFKPRGLLLTYGDLVKLVARCRQIIVQQGAEVQLGKLQGRAVTRSRPLNPERLYSHRLIDQAVAHTLFLWKQEIAGRTPDTGDEFVPPPKKVRRDFPDVRENLIEEDEEIYDDDEFID